MRSLKHRTAAAPPAPTNAATESVAATPGIVPLSATIVRLREDMQQVAERIVADAYGAWQRGVKAETFHRRASELDRQAFRAGELSRNWAAEALRAASAEKRLVAEALDIIESGSSV